MDSRAVSGGVGRRECNQTVESSGRWDPERAVALSLATVGLGVLAYLAARRAVSPYALLYTAALGAFAWGAAL